MSKIKVALFSGLIILAGVATVALIYSTEPTAQTEGATKESAMLVSVDSVEKGHFTPVFQATGTVVALEDIQLSAQVSGQVIRRNPQFVPGGMVKQGTELLKIDPADYLNQIELRKSELMQAKTDLEVEMGRQKIAKQDLKLIGVDSLTQDQKDLILRKPQLSAVEARIKAAEAALSQAQLNLERTSITAPFDAQIISQDVSLGSQLNQGDAIGRLVGIEQYWVEVSLPVKKLKWLRFPDNGRQTGAKVTIKNTSDWEEGDSRSGYLANRVGALDEQTRLARLFIKAPDPLNLQNRDQPELIIGSFVEVEIEGEPIEEVVRLNRDYLRTDQTVWVMENEKLRIKPVDIKLIDAHYVYIADGLADDAKVLTTNISTVNDGIPLRTETKNENNSNE
ncbi:MAG TPA: efflux RND transporter periplasmic adaptor subunit [Saprospiraceae bacterium]|nr:efflux RND transporter periplasmic adaptor subunit [Saprospiraceae bacterium]